MIDKYVKEFTYEELLATLEIINTIKREYKTTRQKEKIELAEMKYNYWKMVSEIRGRSPVVLGGQGY